MPQRLIDNPSLRDYRALLKRRYAKVSQFVYPDLGFLANLLAHKAAYLQRGRARAFALKDRWGVAAFAVAFVDPRLQGKNVCTRR